MKMNPPKLIVYLLSLIGLSMLVVACSTAPVTPEIDPTQGALLLAGTYSTVVGAEDLENFDTLDAGITGNLGHWSITLTDEGDFTANLDGGWIADGNYTVNGSSIEVYIESVCNDCLCQANISRYVWSLEADKLYFRKVADSCDGLALVMTTHPLSRVP